jgi:hypothetical protein
MRKLIAGVVAMAVMTSLSAQAADGIRVLYLTKSSGFEHSVIKHDGDKLGLSEQVMTDVVKKMGGTIVVTKDADKINADNLKNFDVVIFCTTGDLTQPSKDGGAVMGPNGCAEMLAWVKEGHGFIGYHNGSDSFHSPEGSVSPYVEMLGGEFKTHGPQFKGTVITVDAGHPAIASLPKDWNLQEEWYINKNLDTANMHVLALLDLSSVKGKKGFDAYQIPNYPVIWCKAYGKGRVLYDALGHREETWQSPDFQKVLLDGLKWAKGEGELKADPNYSKVVPAPVEQKK